MAQIKISLRTVIRDKDLSVLGGVHCTGIDIDVRIEFLHGDPVAPGLHESPKGCCGDPFSKPRNHTSCNKYIFHTHGSLQ